jgi:hypothetical protein
VTLEDLFAVRAGDLPRLTERELADVCAAIDRRLLDEIHACAFCGGRARVALMANASDLFGPAAWLDLCAAHDQAVRELLTADPFLDDPGIICRYEAWAASRSAGDTG